MRKKAPKQVNTVTTDWCESVDSWLEETTSMDDLMTMITTKMDKMNTRKTKPQTESTANTPSCEINLPNETEILQRHCFPPVYLGFDTEPVSKNQADLQHELELLENYKKQQPDADFILSQADEAWAGETYEKSTRTDSVFKKFQKRLQRAPWQILRYEMNGEPLFYHDDAEQRHLSTKGTPACQYCGGKTQFEMQLMPASLTHFTELHDRCGDIGFGTILIYTCSKNCDVEFAQRETFHLTANQWHHIGIYSEVAFVEVEQ
jgi:hypothetical protein